MLVAVVLGITGWAGSAVVLRAQARSLRIRDYVAASRVAGEKTTRIILVEILPNLLPLLASQFLFAVIFAILGEAGLSYLGLGPTGSITWGTMLYDAQTGQALGTGAWWWFVPPGLHDRAVRRRPVADQLLDRRDHQPEAAPRRPRTRAACGKAKRAGRGVESVREPRTEPPHEPGCRCSRRATSSIEYQVDPPGHAVRDVSLTLHRGEILGLAGESGCGKTTLAYGVNRLLKPPARDDVGRDRVPRPRPASDIDVVGARRRGAAGRSAGTRCRWCSRAR